jgi:hypothetical protein
VREILPSKLWLGNAADVRDVKSVLAWGIAAVIDLAMDEPPALFPRDVIYCRLPLVDGEGNLSAVIQAATQTTVSFVQAEIATLTGCSGGMSRSPCIAAAALALIERRDPDDMLKQIAGGGPHDVSPALWADVKAAILSG